MRSFAPGRVNLIGEHTDYNGGLALPFAIADGVTVTVTPRDDGVVVARALDLGEEDRFAAAAPPPASGWRAYVRGVVAELGSAGADLDITGTVPRDAGLSSSAALTVALALALALAPDADRLELAQACSRVENDWAGARTGLLDELASLFGAEGYALRIDFTTLDIAPVRCELGEWRLVTVDSGEARAIGASGYNERRAECTRAAELLAAGEPLPDPLDRRMRHVDEENARVDQAVAALAGGDLEALGGLLDASHTSLRDLYDCSTPAVERTVRALRDAGAAGARMMGGGFGGHVLALFPPGVEPPAGALSVAPSAGARVLP